MARSVWASWPMVWMPRSASRVRVAGPTPQMSPTGSRARKASSASGATTTTPSGFATWEAILARCLVRATPTEMGRPIWVRTRRRMAAAISAGEPNSWRAPATSRKASSMDTRSTRGVKESRTSRTSSPRRLYSAKCPGTNDSPGHSWRARHPGMPAPTPKARAS